MLRQASYRGIEVVEDPQHPWEIRREFLARSTIVAQKPFMIQM